MSRITRLALAALLLALSACGDAFPTNATNPPRTSQPSPRVTAPPMPDTLAGYRPRGPLQQITLRIIAGDTIATIPGFPVTMNGCAVRQLTVRWRAIDGDIAVGTTWAYVPGVDATPTRETVKPTIQKAGLLILDGCGQPAFFAATAQAGHITNLAIEWQEWYAAA